MTRKHAPQRGAFGHPRDSTVSVAKAVEKGDQIQLATLTQLLALLETKTDYEFHIEVAVNTGGLVKTIDNERDACETIRRLIAAPAKRV